MGGTWWKWIERVLVGSVYLALNTMTVADLTDAMAAIYHPQIETTAPLRVPLSLPPWWRQWRVWCCRRWAAPGETLQRAAQATWSQVADKYIIVLRLCGLTQVTVLGQGSLAVCGYLVAFCFRAMDGNASLPACAAVVRRRATPQTPLQIKNILMSSGDLLPSLNVSFVWRHKVVLKLLSYLTVVHVRC